MKNTIEEKELIKTLKKSSQTIEKISNQRTKSMLDINNHGNGYLVENDWQEEIVSHYNFFITMLGLIEANIINIAKTINKDTDKEDLIDLGDSLEILTNKRQKIINNYYKVRSDLDLSVIDYILKEPFVYQNLDKIYGDLEVNNYKYNLHQEFINAYNKGSMLAKNCDIKIIFLEYTRLWLTFNKTKTKNRRIIHKTGNEKILNRIISYKNIMAKNREN